MIHYSILPEDQVFAGMDTFEPKYEMVRLENCDVMIERSSNNASATIVRLFSPEPQHYLNPKLAPGTVVELSYGDHSTR